MARELIRTNINIPVETNRRLEDYAAKMGITKTGAIMVLVNQALDAQQNMSTIEEMLNMIKAEKGKSES